MPTLLPVTSARYCDPAADRMRTGCGFRGKVTQAIEEAGYAIAPS